MSKQEYTHDAGQMPDIPGLTFRGLQGEIDYPQVLEIILSSREADRINEPLSLEDLAQAYAAAISEQLSANIWYSLNGWRASELIDESGQPLPAFQAMSASASLLRDMDYSGLVDSGTGVTGYRFEKDGMRVWLVWSWDGAPHPLWLEQPPDAVLDVYGASLPVDKDQTKITIAPLYLIWSP